LSESVGRNWKLSNSLRFQKYWISEALFHKRALLPGIQLLEKKRLLDMPSKKFFTEAPNTYPLF
jgi:hypothetical protein